MTNYIEDRNIIFIHIPRTGGVTLRNILSTRFNWNEILWVESDSDIPKSDEKLAKYKFVTGHFSYNRIVLRYPGKPFLITFLRHPVGRVISNAYYMKWYVKTHPNPESLKSIGLSNKMSIEEFILSDDPKIVFMRDNVQTRMLSDIRSAWGVDSIGKESLASAKLRLDSMSFIGLQEQMSASIAMLSGMLGIPFPGEVPVMNPAFISEKKQEIHPNLIAHIEEKNHLDIELYRIAEKMFMRRFEVWQRDYSPDTYRKKFTAEVPKNTVKIDFKNKINGWGWYNPTVKRLNRISTVIHFLDTLSSSFKAVNSQVKKILTDPQSVQLRISGALDLFRRFGQMDDSFRWSGPTPISFIDLNVARGTALDIKFELRPEFNTDLAKKLKVSANNCPIKIRYSSGINGKWLYEGNIPESAYRPSDAFLRIFFEVPNTRRPCDALKGNPDSNPYGLAFYWLEIGPSKQSDYL